MTLAGWISLGVVIALVAIVARSLSNRRAPAPRLPRSTAPASLTTDVMPARALDAWPADEEREWRPASVRVNHLVPDETDTPITPRIASAAGIRYRSFSGRPRQEVIAELATGEPLFLVRFPDNPHDTNAVALFRSTGEDIGMLSAAMAAEIAPRLDRGSPVTARVMEVEPFEAPRGMLLGVRIELTPHKLKRAKRKT